MRTKEQIHDEILTGLESSGIKTAGEDFERPWGGFFKIDNSSLQQFLSRYFSDVVMPFDVAALNVSPKLLVVEPHKKLSWQVHERRSELWRIVDGPVGIFKSETDVQPHSMDIHRKGDLVELKLGTRHRLVGMDDWGVVAEIWVHAFPENLSDENDIRRIEDDFGR